MNDQPSTEDMAQMATTKDDAQRLNKMADDLERSVAELRAQLAEREHQLAQVESELRQRQEEIEQTSRAAKEAHDEVAALQADGEAKTQRIEKLTKDLAAERAWTFRLAGERTAAQNDTKSAKMALAATDRNIQQLHARLADREQSRTELCAELSHERVKLLNERAKVSDLAGRLDGMTAEVNDKIAEIDRKTAEVDCEAETRRLIAEALTDAEAQIAQRFAEIAMLTRMLGDQQDRNIEEKRSTEWLRQVYAVQDDNAGRWRFMSRRWHAQRLHKHLAKRGLFDAQSYLDRYPDIAADGMDPVRHYILHGISEGRKF